MHLLQHLLSDRAECSPDTTAVYHGASSITYAELEAQSTGLAASLTARGVAKHDRVGILLEKSIASIVSVFGILKAGGSTFPWTRRHRPRGWQQSSSTATSGTSSVHPERWRSCFGLRTCPHGWPWWSSPGCHRVPQTIGRPGCAAYRGRKQSVAMGSEFKEILTSDQSPAYILHTSGSTGVPKGVVLSHLNALSFVRMVTSFFAIRASDRMASHASLSFDLSVFDIFAAILGGASIVIIPESLAAFPARLSELIDRERVSIWNSVASVLNMLAARGRLDRFRFDALRLVHFSGDLMPVKCLASQNAPATCAFLQHLWTDRSEFITLLSYPGGADRRCLADPRRQTVSKL